MPFGDRTGPAGQGPRTGHGAGLCSGSAGAGIMNRGGGFGRGHGGGGRGGRKQFCASGLTGWQRAWGGRRTFVPLAVAEVSGTEPERELTALKSQTELLQTTLSQIRKRIEELEAKPR